MADSKNYRKLQEECLARIERYVGRIKKLYSQATSRLTGLASEAKFNGGEQFYFADYPELKKEVDGIVADLATGLEQTILRGTTAEWAKGTIDSNGITEYALSKAGIDSAKDLTDDAMVRYFNNHNSALAAFQKRKIGGLSLSDKVWDLAEHQKIEVELARSIAEGTSADELAKSMQEWLNEPDKLFRRVRDEFGVLRLSKNAAAYEPGAGTYRSSYKNAMRLARTEINMAYRNAELESYQDKPYVVGFEVHRSTNPYPCPVCEALVGKYPKDFVWNGWHPQCRCYIIPILISDDEMAQYTDAIVNGEDFDTSDSVNAVNELPANFRQWIENNRERAKGWSSLPNFIRDNVGYIGGMQYGTYSKAEMKFTRSPKVKESMRKALGEFLQESYYDIPNTNVAAIYHYTRGDISAFRKLNKELRSGFVSPFNEAFSELLSDGLSMLPVYEGEVYRTLKLNRTLRNQWLAMAVEQKGIIFNGFTSTSMLRDIAFDAYEAKLSPKGNETVCRLIITSKRGRNISEISQFNGIFAYPNQQEILFDKGSKFRFIKVEDIGDIIYFWLEEL